MSLDQGAPATQLCRQVRPVVAAHGHGEPGTRLRVIRQLVGLLVIQSLQAIFHAAQEAIGIGELIRRRWAQTPAIGQPGQNIQQLPAPQGHVLATAHQLERLHDELDFPNSAGPQLDVLRHILAGHFLSNEPLHIPQRSEHAVVQVAPIYKGGEDLLEKLRRVSVGGRDGFCFDIGVAFPVAAVLDEIGLQGRQAHRQRPRAAKGSQPRIDAVYRAIRGGGIQQPNNELAQLDKKVAVIQGTIAMGRSRRFV